MRRIEIERAIAAHTPVTEDILDMLNKLKAWTPKTLEQVIEVGNRLIHAANEDIFYATSKERKAEKVPYFMDMKGKMIKYPNGIAHSTEYIYVTGVEIDDKEWETTANITGVRLSKYNRIGNDEVQLYTLPIRFSTVVDMKEDAVTVLVSNYRVEYAIVSNFTEYKDVVARMKAFAPLVQRIPEVMTRDMVKISLQKKPFTKGKVKGDNKVEAKKQFNQRGKNGKFSLHLQRQTRQHRSHARSLRLQHHPHPQRWGMGRADAHHVRVCRGLLERTAPRNRHETPRVRKLDLMTKSSSKDYRVRQVPRSWAPGVASYPAQQARQL